MTVRSSTPLAAAVGLAAVTVEGVRKLPGFLLELPPTVVRELLGAASAARGRYVELAEHGQDVLGHRPAAEPDAEPAARTFPAAAGGFPVPDRTAVADGDAEPLSVSPRDAVPPATEPPVPAPPLGRAEPVTLSEEVLDEVAQLTPGAELAHADLPLADFDHQTVPQLRGRLRTLELPQLVQLRDYEQAHGHRLPVLTLLDNRIAKLAEEPAE